MKHVDIMKSESVRAYHVIGPFINMLIWPLDIVKKYGTIYRSLTFSGTSLSIAIAISVLTSGSQFSFMVNPAEVC